MKKRCFGVKNHPTQNLIQKLTSCISFGKDPQRSERERQEKNVRLQYNSTTGKFYSIMMSKKRKE